MSFEGGSGVNPGSTAPEGAAPPPSTLEAATAFLREAGTFEPQPTQPSPAAQAPPPAASAPEAPPSPQEGYRSILPPDATEGAPSGGGERGPVPYDRFSEVITERNQAREQLSQFDQYQNLVAELADAGLSEGEALEYLRGIAQGGAPEQQPQGYPPQGYDPRASFEPQAAPPQQPQAPAEAFAGWLAQNGVDAAECTRAELVGLANSWRQEQALQQVLAQARQVEERANARWEQSERAALAAQYSEDTQQVKQLYPVFNNPTFERMLHAQASFDLDRGLSLGETAARVNAEIQDLVRNEVAYYATRKQADARVPVTAGGAAPPPVDQPDVTKMTDLDRRTYVRDLLVNARNQAASL